MKLEKYLPSVLYGLLAILSLTGCFSMVTGFLFTSPARGITAHIQERAENYRLFADSALTGIEDIKADTLFSGHSHLLEPLSESLDFAVFSVSAAAVAVHVINIYLILSKPVGSVLLGVLFIVLGLIRYVKRDGRLRNTAMALGTAAWVFMIAMPSAVIMSGQLSRIYTSSLRYAAGNRLQVFGEEGSRLTEGDPVPEDPRRELIVLVKGLPNYVWFASASWLVDLVLLPLLLTWAFYRLGIFLANTLFGSFRIQKLGETVRRVFSKRD